MQIYERKRFSLNLTYSSHKMHSRRVLKCRWSRSDPPFFSLLRPLRYRRSEEVGDKNLKKLLWMFRVYLVGFTVLSYFSAELDPSFCCAFDEARNCDDRFVLAKLQAKFIVPSV